MSRICVYLQTFMLKYLQNKWVEYVYTYKLLSNALLVSLCYVMYSLYAYDMNMQQGARLFSTSTMVVSHEFIILICKLLT